MKGDGKTFFLLKRKKIFPFPSILPPTLFKKEKSYFFEKPLTPQVTDANSVKPRIYTNVFQVQVDLTRFNGISPQEKWFVIYCL